MSATQLAQPNRNAGRKSAPSTIIPENSNKNSAPGAARLDRSEFSVSQYIDRLFPSEGSLESIDVAVENVKRRHQTVTQEIRQLVREESDKDALQKDQTQGVEATKTAIGELYNRISEMRAKARTSERMVQDITQDIKSLDFAKRNLTHTTTTMRRLQLLIGSIEQLRQLKELRRYEEAAKLLPAVNGLREGFNEFMRVKPVAMLNETADVLQRGLASQAYQEVEKGFDSQGLFVGDSRVVHDACLCVDALGEGSRAVELYCDLQLRAYSAIFQLNDDVSQIENISRRYAWLRRILRNYSDEHAGLFPEHWKVGEELSRKFAIATRDHLSEIMATRDSINVDHLMSALTDTMAFESQCNKKFGIVLRAAESESDTLGSFVYENSGDSAETFTGVISCAFEPYMSIFIRAEQSKFDEMIAKFQREPISVDDDPSLSVLASSTDLLYQFRESLRQCAALSTGQAMVDLSQVFNQCLCNYARDILTHKLPRIAATTKSPLLDDLKHVCLIINTADYCASVAGQLEQKIVERIDSEFKQKVTFAACREALLTTINASIRVLVSGVVDTMCEPAFTALAQVPWQNLQMVGDQSSYVLLITSAMEASVDAIRKSMSGTRYFRSFCDKFATRFAEKYMGAINRSGPISEVGAEQLLLDAQALKSALQDMPTVGTEEKEKYKPPAAYTRVVAQGVGKIEAILKAILASSDPPDALIDRFLLLFPKASKETFQQILNLKGVRPADQQTYTRTLRRKLREVESSKGGSEAKDKSNGVASPLTETGPGDKGKSRMQAVAGDLAVDFEPLSASTYLTPEPKDMVPSHVTYGISSSAPISSNRLQQQLLHQRSGLGQHTRLDSNASSSSSMVFGGTSSSSRALPATAGLPSTGTNNSGYAQTMASRGLMHADPLGITGADSSPLPSRANAPGNASTMSSPGARRTATATPTISERLYIPSMEQPDDGIDETSSPVLASLAANATATRTKINENFRKFMSNMRRN